MNNCYYSPLVEVLNMWTKALYKQILLVVPYFITIAMLSFSMSLIPRTNNEMAAVNMLSDYMDGYYVMCTTNGAKVREFVDKYKLSDHIAYQPVRLFTDEDESFYYLSKEDAESFHLEINPYLQPDNNPGYPIDGRLEGNYLCGRDSHLLKAEGAANFILFRTLNFEDEVYITSSPAVLEAEGFSYNGFFVKGIGRDSAAFAELTALGKVYALSDYFTASTVMEHRILMWIAIVVFMVLFVILTYFILIRIYRSMKDYFRVFLTCRSDKKIYAYFISNALILPVIAAVFVGMIAGMIAIPHSFGLENSWLARLIIIAAYLLTVFITYRTRFEAVTGIYDVTQKEYITDIYPLLTGEKCLYNLSLVLVLTHGMKKKEAEFEARSILHMFGIGEIGNEYAGSLKYVINVILRIARAKASGSRGYILSDNIKRNLTEDDMKYINHVMRMNP